MAKPTKLKINALPSSYLSWVLRAVHRLNILHLIFHIWIYHFTFTFHRLFSKTKALSNNKLGDKSKVNCCAQGEGTRLALLGWQMWSKLWLQDQNDVSNGFQKPSLKFFLLKKWVDYFSTKIRQISGKLPSSKNFLHGMTYMRYILKKHWVWFVGMIYTISIQTDIPLLATYNFWHPCTEGFSKI